MADIKINSEAWSSINSDDQQKIEAILRNSNLLHEGSKIVASSAEVESAEQPESFWCELACNAAEAAAVAACAGLSGPAMGVCIAAAHAGGALCRSKC